MNRLRNQVGRWQAAAGRALSSFEQLTIARPFHYNLDTQRWSRLIKPLITGVPFGYVEVSLSRIGDHYPLTVVVHTTRSTHADKYLSSIPDSEVKDMEERLGHDMTHWLLYADLWDGLDVTRLADIRSHKPGSPILLPEVMRPECMIEHQLT